MKLKMIFNGNLVYKYILGNDGLINWNYADIKVVYEFGV